MLASDRHRLISAIVTLLLATSAISALATESRGGAGKSTAPAAAPASAASAPRGAVVEGAPLDPALTADPAGNPREAALDRSTDGLVLERRADGTRFVNLQGRFRVYSVLTIAPDGATRFACVEGAAAALALVRAAPHGFAASLPTPWSRSNGPRCGLGPRED
jgi:hypothetical protein